MLIKLPKASDCHESDVTPESFYLSRRSLLGACAGLSGLAMTGTSMAVPLQGKIRLAGWSKPISEITNILVEPEKGFFKANGVELAYLPGAGGDIVISVIFFIFNVRVGDRRTNGIGVGIAVA